MKIKEEIESKRRQVIAEKRNRYELHALFANRGGIRHEIMRKFMDWRMKNGVCLREGCKMLGCHHTQLYRLELGTRQASDKMLLKVVRILEQKNCIVKTASQ